MSLSFCLSVVMLFFTPSISSTETVCSSKRQHTWGMFDRARWAKFGNENKSCYDRWNGDKNLSACSDHFICCLAVADNNTWDTSYVNNRTGKNPRVEEAQKRGLTCGVRTASKIKSNSTVRKAFKRKVAPLRIAFVNYSKGQRKLIQSNLADLGFYKSSIDGLYGKGTAAALEAYNKEYLGNADLSTAANANVLIADLLKGQPVVVDEAEVVVTANAEVGETELADPAPVPTFTFAQVRASYDARKYAKAFKDAQVLAVEGDADAQLLLGKMYADGRGTLQVATAAHMWFNLAGMNGNDEAFEERKTITASMTATAIEKAQAMAVKCIQSKYQDCGLTIMPVSALQVVAPAPQTVISVELLKQGFRAEPLLKRKQIQYALKKLNFYWSSVDGLWGRGTSSALTNYAKSSDAGDKSTDELFVRLLSKVTVPSSFAVANKPKLVTKVGTQSSSSLTTSEIDQILRRSRPKKDVSFFDLLGAFAEGYNAVDQGFQGSSVSPVGQGCFKTGEYQSGLSKICSYDCTGSPYAMTIGSASLCPLTVNR